MIEEKDPDEDSSPAPSIIYSVIPPRSGLRKRSSATVDARTIGQPQEKKRKIVDSDSGEDTESEDDTEEESVINEGTQSNSDSGDIDADGCTRQVCIRTVIDPKSLMFLSVPNDL
ncbi:uncharacterized protein BDV17DRAFT_286632 [Aspergillus undulatus]|uniref:uncharacterized protein n=1 Tax=Aspergillus undulatus TaxID=1810928 RepID=UPI003CCE4C61